MKKSRRALLKLLLMVPRPLVWRFARTYIAGETLDDAVRTIRELNRDGCRATVDVLGEGVTSEKEVRFYVEQYGRTIEAIVREGLDANVSVKPTAMGLNISPDLAHEAIVSVVRVAERHGMFVRMDMEDSPTTSATLDLFWRLREEGHERVGVVLQAYLRRTLADAARLAAAGASVRLCKGIYVEPRHVAYQDYWLVRDAFVAAMETLMRGGAYTAIATHDEWLVLHGRRLVRELGVAGDRYEFQMLLGVDPELRRLTVAEGHGMRVYVPYGEGWYGYSIRRLVENPRFAGHVVKNVLGLGPGTRAAPAP
ncbi:MAG: proline dehydrogenase family protein [Acidobacteria bacterium]|nr:proline dehydrogenase family protein [Acidobacteriota bacterium]